MNNESRALGRDSLDIASTHESWHQNWHQFIPSTESWAVVETTNTSCQAASDVGNNILDLTVVSWTIDAGGKFSVERAEAHRFSHSWLTPR
ncbi:hypothetical protein DER44DRAFT_525307 [Fusarium oxysporum]|nr:hypothetical protein DER44DRAFT_525307 [Fusarium oxysporum]